MFIHRTTLIFVVQFIFISFTTFAQMTEEEYNSKKESLTHQKKGLKGESETLKTKIESFQNRIPELEKKIITTIRELFVLKYGEEISRRVAYKQICKGMTHEMVRDGWGEPDKIDRNVEKWGVFNSGITETSLSFSEMEN